MSDLIRMAALRDPTALALDDGNGRRIAYSDLDQRVGTVAAHLAARGAMAGDTLVMLTAAQPEQVVWVHAAWRCGCVVVPLHPKSTASEVAAAVQAVRPRLTIVDDDTESSLAPAKSGRGATDVSRAPGAESPIVVNVRSFSGPSESTSVPTPVRGRAAIVWTSGTEGRPRGVALTWEALLIHADASRARLGLIASDRWYASLSLAHVGGLALIVRAATIGSAVTLPGPFSVADFIRLAEQGRITHASLVPVMLQRILDVTSGAPAPEPLRAILLGGGAAPPALVERAQALGYPVAPTYGLSEASSQVATATPAEARERPDAVGTPLPGVEARVAADGEILVRGPTLAECYVGSETDMVDNEGWLHTGDLGELDEDGVLRILGRRTERVVTGGMNVDPIEVEARLRALPEVTEACVVGVSDEAWGEKLVALLVPAAGGPSSDEDLRRRLAVDLRPEKLPKAFHWVGSLPRNRMDKLDRPAVRRIAVELEA